MFDTEKRDERRRSFRKHMDYCAMHLGYGVIGGIVWAVTTWLALLVLAWVR